MPGEELREGLGKGVKAQGQGAGLVIYSSVSQVNVERIGQSAENC